MSQFCFGCAGWLRVFLQRRGLDAPDQRSLYEYHCSYEEYLELRQLLKKLGSFDATLSDLGASACLVIYCSEWYRREYQRHHGWSWYPVWQTLGYRLSPADLSKSIPAGLERYWKRPIHLYDSDRRDFLGTLFSEGGLPFQALREGGSRFQMLFDRVLKNYEEGHLIGYSTAQLIKTHLEKLNVPKVFFSLNSVELMAHMADRLVSLVRDYDLAQVQEPVARLNAMSPQWRELFPLPLDNETGTELLNGLLKTATVETRRRRKSFGGWSCHHIWHDTNPDELKVHISMPPEVVFHLSSQPSTTRFELAIFEEDTVLAGLGPGYAQIDQGVARIRLRLREVIAVRRDCSVPLSLVAMAGGLILGSLPIEGSAVGLGEVPVGFEWNEDRWKLCGQASFSTPSEEVLVVLPVDGGLQTIDGSSEAQLIGEPTIRALPVLKVRGKGEFRVTTQDESTFYRLRTGHVLGARLGVTLTGTELGWSTRPTNTFTGLPRVQWAGAASELTAQGGELLVGGCPAGAGVLQESFGAQYVSVRNRSGDILLRQKVGVLPADFRVELKGGDSPKHGCVLIFTKHRCIFQVAQEALGVRQFKKDNHIELQLSADGLPPTRLRLLVTPNLGADPIELDLPFPGSGCVAVNKDSTPLPRDICIDDLLGARLYLYPRPGVATTFNLNLGLLGGAARNAHHRWSYSVSGRPVEVRLFNIQDQILDLLSLKAGIDQVVDLRVSAQGYETIFRIRKYASELFYDAGRQVLGLHTYLRSAVCEFEPALMLLHEPMRSTIDLLPRTSEGIATGEFEVPTRVEKDGPWLIVPKAGSPASFRPLFIPGGWERPCDDGLTQTLQKAVLAFDLVSTVNSFTPVLDAMATNPMHSGWQFLRSLYDSYGYLPLATFEVWKSLVAHPKALVMALFKFEADPEFLVRLEGEFPVLWELLPIEDVRNSVSCFRDFMLGKGVSEEALQGILGRMMGRISDIFTSYGEDVQRYLAGRPLGPDVHLPQEAINFAVQRWYMELIRGRSEAQWPEYGGRGLQAWHARQHGSVICFDVEMGYRYSVVYFPVFAAAVANGQAKLSDVFDDVSEAVFFLRQVRDFDKSWFNVIYQQSLLRNAMNKDKAMPDNE
ncbi:STY4851/ECs_5259 family protein [Larsenimonas suaedae]|uniref:STY4851/ECs_5259 family protein n=1 Tax=Larsenimonas suaedae TaxID=1851019 RepID=A0ABU1GVG9_9GAMM|nr:STY4851/ECs_5259 family protein [Larsenimonas suaedae]MCM2971796.1 STY4851/ECs_5259 family protein [Larsenimonas suaedae]MDR5895348.1 STY4851/ECs_5259 family protein [Larsenimonas suaedae]